MCSPERKEGGEETTGWDNGALKPRRGFLDRKLQGSRGDWQKNDPAVLVDSERGQPRTRNPPIGFARVRTTPFGAPISGFRKNRKVRLSYAFDVQTARRRIITDSITCITDCKEWKLPLSLGTLFPDFRKTDEIFLSIFFKLRIIVDNDYRYHKSRGMRMALFETTLFGFGGKNMNRWKLILWLVELMYVCWVRDVSVGLGNLYQIFSSMFLRTCKWTGGNLMAWESFFNWNGVWWLTE